MRSWGSEGAAQEIRTMTEEDRRIQKELRRLGW
jgi:hypothetical protein